MSDTLTPESIYTLFAKLFADVAREVKKDFGAAGEEAVRRGVRAFGERRGRKIAANAAAAGKPNTLENYLPYYDMERSELFLYDTEYKNDLIDQKFHQCPFAKAWTDDGDQELGHLYCDDIDRSVARGFNPDLTHCELSHLLAGAPCCHMTFKMKEQAR